MESLRRSSIDTLLDIATVWAKASTTIELPLYNKLDRVTVPRHDWGKTVDSDPEARQGTKDDLYDEISSDTPCLNWNVDDMMTSYQLGPRGMVGSVVYSLTQQSTRLGMSRAATRPMTLQFVRSVMR